MLTAADSLLDLCCCRLEDGGRLPATMRLLSQMMERVVGLSRTWLTSAAAAGDGRLGVGTDGARRRRSRTSQMMQPESYRSTSRESNRSSRVEGSSCTKQTCTNSDYSWKTRSPLPGYQHSSGGSLLRKAAAGARTPYPPWWPAAGKTRKQFHFPGRHFQINRYYLSYQVQRVSLVPRPEREHQSVWVLLSAERGEEVGARVEVGAPAHLPLALSDVELKQAV